VEGFLHAAQGRLSMIGEGVPWYWLWLGLTLIILGLFLAYWRRVHPRLVAGVPPSGRALMVLALLIVVATLKATPTGDEPHFLIMSQSLLNDGDFDLRNNYLNRDYLEFHPGISDPHVIVEGQHWYPIHSPGLPVLAAPGFAVGGRAGVVVMLALLTVAGLRLVWSLMTRAGFAPRAKVGAVLAVAFTLPLASMAGQVFSEVPAFFFTALALRAILAPTLAGWDLAALAISVAVLPWLHPKFIVLAGGLLAAAVVAHRRREAIPSLAAVTGLLVASVLGVALLTYVWFHSWIPGRQISLGGHSSWVELLTKNFHLTVGYAGVLFDQQSGLLFASPVFILAIAGILLLWRRREHSLALICVLIAAAVYLPAASWSIWYGGFASPARLLTPLLPVLAVGIASALDGWETRARRIFYVLMVPSALYAFMLVTLPDFTRYGDPATDHNYFIARFERLTQLDLTPLFPTFRHVSSTTWPTTAVYLAACLAICIFVIAPQSRLAIRRGSLASPNAGSRTMEVSPTAITRGDRPGTQAAGRREGIEEHDDWQGSG
jgi:hypothetical protein